MSDQKPAAGMVTINDARTFLARELGTAPDAEMLKEWLRQGYLVGEEKEGETLISQDSLKSLAAQLSKVETKRPPRLALHAVDIWRRESDRRAVAVTLATKSNVVTAEHVCQNSEPSMLEGAVKATLEAISQAVLTPFEMKLIQVNHHSLANIEQSIVAVLVSIEQGEDSLKLSGVAMTAASASPIEAAARATLNALNRNLSPYLQEPSTWRDIIKKLLPV